MPVEDPPSHTNDQYPTHDDLDLKEFFCGSFSIRDESGNEQILLCIDPSEILEVGNEISDYKIIKGVLLYNSKNCEVEVAQILN